MTTEPIVMNHRTGAGHRRALWEMAAAHNALAAILGLAISMPGIGRAFWC
jgi:hypothetical protein